jgi:hypothetical protein
MSTSAPSKPPSPVQQPLLPSGQSAALPATLAATPISSGAMVLVPPGAPAAAIPPTLTLAQIVASPTDLSHAMRDVQLTLNAMLTGQLAYAAIHHSRRYHPSLRRRPRPRCRPPCTSATPHATTCAAAPNISATNFLSVRHANRPNLIVHRTTTSLHPHPADPISSVTFPNPIMGAGLDDSSWSCRSDSRMHLPPSRL